MSLLLFVFSCSDYAFNSPDEAWTPPEPGTEEAEPERRLYGDIEVTPTSVDLAACSIDVVEVTIGNVGTGPLTVDDIALDDDVWDLAGVPLPFVLDPGSSQVIGLVAREGIDSLVVTSDDPDEGTVVVSLASTLVDPPQITMVSPTDGVVLDPLADVELRASVEGADGLAVQWFSDVDGYLLSTPVEPDGTTNGTWLGADRSFGAHVVTVKAIDVCEQEAEDVAEICHAENPDDLIELPLDTFHREGSAMYDAAVDELKLTNATGFDYGAGFYTEKTFDVGALSISFEANFGNITDMGADGIAFVALDVDAMTTFVAGEDGDLAVGGAMGFADGCEGRSGVGLPGWAIEIDTYQNTWDPVEDHVAFVSSGEIETPVALQEIPDLEDGAWHEVVVEIEAPRIHMTIDGTVVLDQEVGASLAFPAYVGFTSSTGGRVNEHRVRNVRILAPCL